MISLLLLIFVTAHYCACGFFVIGDSVDADDDSWL